MRTEAPFCVLGLLMAVGGLSLENISKDWLGFLPLLRRVSQDTSYVWLFFLRSWFTVANVLLLQCLWFR
jgi:hypothetical protein